MTEEEQTDTEDVAVTPVVDQASKPPKRTRAKPEPEPEPESFLDPDLEPTAIKPKHTTAAVQMASGAHKLPITTDQNGNGRVLISLPEKMIERVKCEDLPGSPYVAQASQQTTWLGVYGAIPNAVVTISFNVSEFHLG